jgi:hypothetical protein
MSKILRVAVLTAALLAALTSTAGAVTWHNSGNTAFSASGPPTTLHFGAVHIPCTQTAVTGTASATPFVGTSWTGISTTATYSDCTLAGSPLSVECTGSETLTGQTGGVSTGSLSSACNIYLANTVICTMNGTTGNTYTNPSGGATGRFTQSQASATLGNGPQGTCPFTSPATLTHTTWTVTSGTGGPVITRTP